MDKKVVLDEDTTRCAFCNNYLSVAPVLAFSAEDEAVKYKCGRCREVECKMYTRILCYEKVAKYLAFPCTYRQCGQHIPWGQVEDHEKVCPYRMLPCPVFYQNCNDMVPVSDLASHFMVKHSGNQFRNIRYERIVTSMKVNEFVAFLLIHKKQQYFVYICINELEPSYVSVFSISTLTSFDKFNLELSSPDRSSSISYKNQNIVVFDERQHCLKCNERECYKKYHPYSLVYSKPGENTEVIVTNLKMPSIIDLLDRPDSITFTISLVEEEDSPQKKARSI